MTLNARLAALEASGLIRLAQVEPELEYLFRHALVQDAAYASLVKFDRIELHRAVGEALERLYPDRLASQELAPRLGHHFVMAGDDERALRYFTLAGDNAARVYANFEAVMHYLRALEIAKRLGTPPVTSLRHLYSQRGHALELSNRYPEALDNYTEMLALARKHSDRTLELAALAALAKIRSTPTPLADPAEGQAFAEQALALARTLGDRPAECKALWILMLACYFGSRPQSSMDYGEQALTIARELGEGGREQLAYILNDISRSYIAVGHMERALATLSEARVLWRELGNLPMLADNLNSSSDTHYMTGAYDLVLTYAEEGLRLSQSIHNQWGQAYSQWMRGYGYWEQGQLDRSLIAFEEAIRLCEQNHFDFFLVFLTQ